jgi:hypothetical protein
VPGNVLRHFARDDVTEFEFTHRRQHAARGKAELLGLGLSMMFNDLAAGKPPEPAGQVIVTAMTLIAPMVELGPEIRVVACWVAPDPQGRLSYSVSAFKESIIPLLGDGGVALSEAILCGYRQGQTETPPTPLPSIRQDLDVLQNRKNSPASTSSPLYSFNPGILYGGMDGQKFESVTPTIKSLFDYLASVSI